MPAISGMNASVRQARKPPTVSMRRVGPNSAWMPPFVARPRSSCARSAGVP